jgi:hypothetical protein
VEGVWIVVGVERTPERKVFAVPIEKRDEVTLRQIVFDHVVPGSIIHTDLWKGYGFIDDCVFYEHGTVNHSAEFKNAMTGVHTNYVEGTNSGIKRCISVRSRVRGGIEEHLGEFAWRRKHERGNTWDDLMHALVEIEYE